MSKEKPEFITCDCIPSTQCESDLWKKMKIKCPRCSGVLYKVIFPENSFQKNLIQCSDCCEEIEEKELEEGKQNE